MIKGRRDFVQRSQLDIDEKPPSSLFGAFRDTVRRILPGVHERLGIHELPQMAVSVIGSPDAVGNQLAADDIERLLINSSITNLFSISRMVASTSTIYRIQTMRSCILA